MPLGQQDRDAVVARQVNLGLGVAVAVHGLDHRAVAVEVRGRLAPLLDHLEELGRLGRHRLDHAVNQRDFNDVEINAVTDHEGGDGGP